MPGTVILKPIKAKLTKENETFLKMDPYCSLSIGEQEINGKVCKSGGQNPTWEDQLIFRRNYEPVCTLQIKDKEFFKNDPIVGTAEIDLKEIESQGKLTKWYQVGHGNEVTGEILIEATFAPDSSGASKQTPQEQSYSYQASSHKNGWQSLYPPNIYSPERQSSLGLNRPISQVQMPEIYGYHNKDQLITYPHISHHIAADEYSKMHSRNVERYQPTNKVVPDQKKPPSWEGYKTPDYLLPEEPVRVSVTPSEPEQEDKLVGSLDNVKISEDSTKLSAKENDSTKLKSPVNSRRQEKVEIPKSPQGLHCYPMIGGVSYAPKRGEAMYKPIYDWPNKDGAGKEKNKAKVDRKLSDGSNSTGTNSTNTNLSSNEIEGTSLAAI